MKHWTIAACCVFALAGCASDYIIATNDGRMLDSQYKPRLDDDTGLLQYQDHTGRSKQIPQSHVRELIQR